MLTVSEEEILRRLRADSPWWENRNDIRWKEAPRRVYFAPFFELIEQKKINRAVVLTGSRRVGKTVMVHQAIAELIRKKVEPKRILYVPLDNSLYSGLPIEKILFMFARLNSITRDESCYLFFDEIQYLGDWERHLKSLVDSYPQHRFTVVGSAAAALRLKSGHSGAGRFTDFILPHLTFHEYFKFSGAGTKFFGQEDAPHDYPGLLIEKIEELNKEFADYINLGGYPEAVFSEETGADPGRFIRNGFVEKVLLRDLPNLYGIRDIKELNRLFATLVYNTGREIDPQGISEGSNAAKGTVSRYLEYLEAAFLIKRVSRIDRNARKFRRERKFKVYTVKTQRRKVLHESPETVNAKTLFRLLFVLCFLFALSDTSDFSTGVLRFLFAPSPVVILEHNRGKLPSQVPLKIIGQHAQKQMPPSQTRQCTRHCSALWKKATCSPWGSSLFLLLSSFNRSGKAGLPLHPQGNGGFQSLLPSRAIPGKTILRALEKRRGCLGSHG